MEERITYFIKTLVGFCILYAFAYTSWLLYNSHYDFFAASICDKLYLPDLTEQYAKSVKGAKYYFHARWIILVVCLLWSVRLYNVVIHKATLLGNVSEKLFTGVAVSVIANISYIKNLAPGTRHALLLALLLQGTFFGYYMCTLPYNYDEVFSYNVFSGKGVLTSLSYYIVPNNHILQNIAAVIFLKLPIKAIVAMRLVSLLASTLSTYYFFKIAYKILSPFTAIIAMVLFSFSYPLTYFATQARGYALMLLLSILCTYAFACLAEGKSLKKYLSLYTASSILGFFTIPSFLYFFVVINTLLLLHIVFKFRWQTATAFILSNITIACTTILLYTPIILRNGWEVLVANNGVIARDEQYIRDNIKPHLLDTYKFFTGGSSLSLDWIYLLFGFIAVHALFKGYVNRLYSLMTLTFLLSPLFIITQHGTIPFERTWIYLIVPFCIGIGMMFHILQQLFIFLAKKSSFNIRFLPSLSSAIVLVLSIVMLARFSRRLRENHDIDFVTQRYAQILDPKFSSLTSYGYFWGDFSFYLAEGINFESLTRPKATSLNMHILSDNDRPKADIIILDKNKNKPLDLQDYYVVNYENPYFIVYLRKDL